VKRDLSAESKVRAFYDGKGWATDASGTTGDAELWEDLRPCAREYVSACRLKLTRFLPPEGDLILDAASGPVQYPEYLEYSRNFRKRVCVDLSQKALDQAKDRLGSAGEYVCASILDLPFPDRYFDAVVSLHTIYHIDRDQQEDAVRQLIRVTKPAHPVVIVYSNPDRLLKMIKRSLTAKRSPPPREALYFFVHPLGWWHRFTDECRVDVHPWRALAAQDSRRLIPNNKLGQLELRAILSLEKHFPRMVTRLGAYPLIVLTRCKE
jgi:ubiquinone/menaquinone biosynthesis C-methylase UbiE